jgi:hypothetical protein
MSRERPGIPEGYLVPKGALRQPGTTLPRNDKPSRGGGGSEFVIPHPSPRCCLETIGAALLLGFPFFSRTSLANWLFRTQTRQASSPCRRLVFQDCRGSPVAGFSFFLEPLSLIGYLEPKRGRLVALVAGWFFNLLQNMSTNQVLFF